TASKWAWVKENEPSIYERVDKVMLPGDFIAMKLTGEITTTISALSEGIFWDFREDNTSSMLADHFEVEHFVFPAVNDLFAEHGSLTKQVAETLSLRPAIPVTYNAGDQPHTAFSSNVLEPG